MYRDRRSNKGVDASRAIWILATNTGDAAIEHFHAEHFAGKNDVDVQKISLAPLRNSLESLFSAEFTVSQKLGQSRSHS